MEEVKRQEQGLCGNTGNGIGDTGFPGATGRMAAAQASVVLASLLSVKFEPREGAGQSSSWRHPPVAGRSCDFQCRGRGRPCDTATQKLSVPATPCCLLKAPQGRKRASLCPLSPLGGDFRPCPPPWSAAPWDTSLVHRRASDRAQCARERFISTPSSCLSRFSPPGPHRVKLCWKAGAGP